MSETNNNGGQPQGGQQGGEGGAPAPAPITAEQAAKMQEQIDNLNIALAQERETTKGFKTAEAKRQQDELAAKGEFEKVRSQQETTIADLTKANEELSKKVTDFETHFAKMNDDTINALPKEQQDIVKELIVGKNAFEAHTLLPKLIGQLSPKGPKVGKDPNGKPTDADVSRQAQVGEAVKKGDFSAGFKAIMTDGK